ncbi:MAG: ATP-grasp domain-containing protein [Bacillota bacterium]|nr:ATP-grasp domain-containing protein [Bacillota bacterium]
MNFVFISANYPDNYWMFCRGLKRYGARVLAIVDTPYNMLSDQVKQFCDECYVVQSFHNYDEVFRAVAYFSFKYGKIDWIESNNEAWLTLDARLRDDFNVKTGFSLARIEELQSKAGMKKYYEKAGVPTARHKLVKSLDEALTFAKEVGYPLVLKPDHGVGASFTYKCENDEELIGRFNETAAYQMILEEFIDGEVFTLDGVCDANGDIRYLSSMEYIGNCMDSVSKQTSIGSYTALNISQDYFDIVQRTIKAFEIRNRFFHCEWFRLNVDKPGLGKKGDVIGLEVNFRAPGGLCPDLMNYSCDMDVYDLWAQVILTQDCEPHPRHYSAGFAGRRNAENYKYSVQDIERKYAGEWINTMYLSPALAAGMGDVCIVGKFKTEERTLEFYRDAFELA